MQNDPTVTKLSADDDFGSKTDALVKLGLMTVGAQIATEVIHRLARYPLIVFGLDVATGVYPHQHRQKIVRTANPLRHQGPSLLPFQSGEQ